MPPTGPIRPGPELALLLQAVRRALPGDGAGSEAGAAEAASGVPDLPALFALARRHRLVPHLCRELLAGGAAIGEEQRRRIGAVRERLARRALAQAAELLRLTGLLEAAGIEVLALKGPELAVEVFGDVAARWCRDLDLLVRPADAAAAAEILAGQGYRWMLPDGFRFDSRLGRSYLAHGAGQVEMRHPDGGGPVELHWKLAHPQAELPLPEERLWPGRRIDLGGGGVAALPRPVLLVYLCHHGSRHRWRRLHWLADVAGLLRVAAEEEWQEAVELAGECGVGTALGLAAALAGDLFAAPQPQPLAARARWLERGRRLAAEIALEILAPLTDGVRWEGVLARQRWGLALQTRWRHRLRPGFWLWPLALTPADLDWPGWPDRLAPLLYLLRPARALARRVRPAAPDPP